MRTPGNPHGYKEKRKKENWKKKKKKKKRQWQKGGKIEGD